MQILPIHNISRTLVLFTASLLGGCAQPINIPNTLTKDEPHILSIDAKQRVVLASPNKVTGSSTALMRFCAEPPPDVFTALAASLGAEVSASKSATPEVAAKLATTLSENAATIERTQTVNILRETMYRNCERYLSGAITAEEFIVQAARDQQLIVQVLAVEQITGVSKAQSTALTTVANAAASGVSDASLAALSEARKDFEVKRIASETAVNSANDQSPIGTCGNSAIDTANLPDGVTAEQATAKNAKCTEATKAGKLAKEAEDYFTLVKKTVEKQGAVSSETQGKLATAVLTVSAASTNIAEKVVEIVRQYQAFDEIGMSCVVKLRTESDTAKFKFCEDLLIQMAKTRAAQLQLEEGRLNAERVTAYRTEINAASLSAAETVWGKLGPSFDSEKVDQLTKKAGIELAQAHKQRLIAANADFAAFAKAFLKLALDQQERLAKAAGQD